MIFAGYLLFYLAKNHCFVDGNKRLAWSATMHVLLGLGLTVDASTDEAEEFVLSVITSERSTGMEVVRWLAGRLLAAEDVVG